MYTQLIDRQHPGCLLFLLDQSNSMEDPLGGTPQAKSEALSQAVNRLLRNVILRCQRGNEVRDYFEIGIIGYSDDTAQSTFGGQLAGQHLVPISVVADFPMKMVTDSMPGNPELAIDLPVWVEPHAYRGTPMVAAINLAGSMVVDWANTHPDSFPPIVVNISDGESTDGDPRPVAQQLRTIRTNDGNLLLFNVALSSVPSKPIEYPDSPAGLPNAYAASLFEMSSELTPYMRNVAETMGLPLATGARGFMFNADSAKLTEFLDIGTRPPQTDR
jgi:hypothetical protein